MTGNSAFVRQARDARLYLFLGLANWFIFLDHIPYNTVSWFTLRNFGYGQGDDWAKTKAYFVQAWPAVMDSLQKRFDK